MGDCSDTKTCCNDGFVCAKKDKYFTGCTQTVKKTTWTTQKMPIPAGWDGTILGGGRSEHEVKPGGKPAGMSLFCFVAILPGSSEEALDAIAQKNKVGIYACDAHAKFQSLKSGSAGWDTGASTLVNTDSFIKVWNDVKA